MKKILIVDDEPFARTVFKKVALEANINAEVIEAADGNEAWAKLNETEFDLAILDINMPFINGIDLIKKMRDEEKFKNLPCVVVTASTSNEIKEKVAKLGVVEVISKIDVSSRGGEDNLLANILKKYIADVS